MALVDDEDYDYLMQFKWHVIPHKNGTNFYAARGYRKEDGKKSTMLLHRELLNPVAFFREAGGIEVDHINGDPLDNRRCNLRIVTKTENNRNRSKSPHLKTSSRFKGVSFHKRTGLWQAYIKTNDQMNRLGYFADETAAARAYDEGAKRLHGKFAKLNFPEETA